MLTGAPKMLISQFKISFNLILSILSANSHKLCHGIDSELITFMEKSFIKNLDFYSSNRKYPLNNLWVSERQTMRGEEFITITITPFNYYPQTNL